MTKIRLDAVIRIVFRATLDVHSRNFALQNYFHVSSVVEHLPATVRSPAHDSECKGLKQVSEQLGSTV